MEFLNLHILSFPELRTVFLVHHYDDYDSQMRLDGPNN